MSPPTTMDGGDVTSTLTEHLLSHHPLRPSLQPPEWCPRPGPGPRRIPARHWCEVTGLAGSHGPSSGAGAAARAARRQLEEEEDAGHKQPEERTSRVKVDRFSRAAECQKQQPRQRSQVNGQKLLTVAIHELYVFILVYFFGSFVNKVWVSVGVTSQNKTRV